MEPDSPRPVAKALLIALATGVALSIGASIGPDIADRARIWLDRLMGSVEHQALSTIEAIQRHAQLERDVRANTGPVIWEAMQIVEGEAP